MKVLTKNGKYVSIGGRIKNLLQLLFASKVRKRPVYILGLKANKNLEQLHQLYNDGIIKPVIDGPYPLEKSPWAIQHFGEGKHTGKILISLQD